jgi:hypothetical protein
MASLFTPPYFDVGAGITPSDGALLNFYVVGSGTRKNTFTTAAATAGTEHANPVIADALGVFPAIYIQGDYDWVLTDKDGVQKNTGSVSEFVTSTGSAADITKVKNFATLTAAKADPGLLTGDAVNLESRLTALDGAGGMFDVITGTGTANTYNKVAHDSLSLTLVARQEANIINASQYGVLANSDGTTGNGADDTGAWLQAIIDAKANAWSLVGPSGFTRTTGALDFSAVVALFNGAFIKDFDGNGINIIDKGPVYTYLTNPIVLGGRVTESTTSKGINVEDSRVVIVNGLAKNNGGNGYHHIDDLLSNNHCRIEMRCEGNGGTTEYNVHIAKGTDGAAGLDSNNWLVDFQTFAGGGGVLVDVDGKDWSGVVKAEDSTLDGLKLTDGNRIDLNVYLENNGGQDYNIGDSANNVSLTGRLGSGTTNNNTTYRLTSGGNDVQVKGDTIGIIEKIQNTSLGDVSSEYMTRQYLGSNTETMFLERYFGDGSMRCEAIDRTDGTTIVGRFGIIASNGAFIYGNGTSLAQKFVGAGTPEASITAPVGSTYSRTDGGAGTSFYVKESGAGNTGWVGK